nr:unnamed protein product [Callosobruchus analis]
MLQGPACRVKLTSLPSTSGAAHRHFNRVYYQVQAWLGHDLEPQEFGWTMCNGFLEPCKSDCGVRCGCRKAGLQCSLACGQYNGQACLSAVAYETHVNEDRTFDPEIREELETNVIEDDNEDNNDLEILELREDDDDEEDPEIGEELETNVTEDDNEDNNDLGILELREDDDDEEDKN